ncbi:MAG: HAD family hydrolase [Clostridia bacterium]|nr:HAD family hydrolase [Clostridia bacterium]
MEKYRYLIFDVDDTLLDYGYAYRTAQNRIAERLNMAYTEQYAVLDEKCGWRAWKESGLDNTGQNDIQVNYHRYYYQYHVLHYTYLMEALGKTWDPNLLAEWYMEIVSDIDALMETDTLYVYRKLASRYRLVLATNALERMQRKRLTVFLPYTYKIFISETMGYIKPASEFFVRMLDTLECCPQECLMVGDSWANDILGAKQVGIDVCYYNRIRKTIYDTIVPEYKIQKISELLEIL